jgi:hypothetical protein
LIGTSPRKEWNMADIAGRMVAALAIDGVE